MYDGVPMTPLPRAEEEPSARAMPKSMTRGPSGPISTLDGLKSRCRMPARWMAASAVTVPIASRSRSVPVLGPCSPTRPLRDGPGTYSLTT